ncbi:hypothetical protein SB748_25240 [Rhizobium sp. SIMBA_035]
MYDTVTYCTNRSSFTNMLAEELPTGTPDRDDLMRCGMESTMDESVAAVRLLFPLRTEAIDELASRDETFLEICADLAEAKRELSHWQSSTDLDRNGRCEEYEELIAWLAKEVEEALDGKTLPLHPPSVRPIS